MSMRVCIVHVHIHAYLNLHVCITCMSTNYLPPHTRLYKNLDIITTTLKRMKQAAPRRVTGWERERGCGQQRGVVAGRVAALTDVFLVCDGGGW